jgi:MHS family shikimate/dehydroshikimate transporter-like MFS transporter
LCLASGIAALISLLPEAQFESWGWRVPFLLSAVLIAVGMYIRLNIMETPAFAQVKETGGEVRIPFIELMRDYPKSILLGMGARYIDGVIFNIYAVFIVAFLAVTMNVPRTTVLVGITIAAIVMIFFIPLFGHLSDRYGRRAVYGIGSLVNGILVCLSFWMMVTDQSTVWLWLAIIIPFGIAYAAVYGPEAALFAELFDTRVRYSGISIVYQFSGIFSSGLTPIIATYLLAVGGGAPWLVVAYAVLVSIISAVSVYLMKETAFSHTAFGQTISAEAPAPLAGG